MAGVKIARGQSSPATFSNDSFFNSDKLWVVDYYGTGSPVLAGNDQVPNGWNFSTGVVTVPVAASLGPYKAIERVGPYDPINSRYPVKVYDFDVVCLAVSLDSTLRYEDEKWIATVTATPSGGTTPYSYAWSGVTAIAGGGSSDNYVTFELDPGTGDTANVTVTDSTPPIPCTAMGSKSVTAPGEDEPVPVGWYCVENGGTAGCVYIGETNDGLVIGATNGPSSTYGECIGACNPIGPYCPEGWLWNGTMCVWAGEGDPPEGPAPGPECGPGYYFNGTTCVAGSGGGTGTGTGTGGSGTGTGGSGTGTGTGGSGTGTGTGSGTGSGTGTGTGTGFAIGYYCLSFNSNTTCEYINSVGEYNYYISNGYAIVSGPHSSCTPCEGGGTGTGTGTGTGGSGTGTGTGGTGTGTGTGGSGSGTGTGTGEPPLGDDCASRVGVKYRELEYELDADEYTGYEIHKLLAMAVEARSGCTNEACHYNVQLGVIGSDANDGDFSEAAWAKFKIVLPSQGAHFGPPTIATYREQKFQSVIIPNPSLKVRLRLRFSPIYELWPLETDSEAVVKLRPLGTDGALMVWTSNPAKMFIYNPPDGRPEVADLFGADRAGMLTLVFDGSNILLDAADATDAALLENKAYVVTADGALMVVDRDSGDEALTVKPRREEIEQSNSESNRIAKFAEAVNLKPLVIWEDSALSTKATRLYDYSFPAPKLAWESDLKFGITQVAEGALYLGTSTKLYSSEGGTAAPVLERNFSSIVTSIARFGDSIYVGLNSGAIWKRSTPSGAGGEGGGTPEWTIVKNLGYRIAALGIWQGGAATERGILGFDSDHGANYESNRIWSEGSNGSWVRDRRLPVPDGLTVDGIVSMQRSIGPARNSGAPNDPNHQTNTQVSDSMVIGTTGDGLLYVYTRSHLDSRYGAFEACSVGVPRLMPVWREIQEVEA